MYKFAEKDLH